MSKLIVTVGQEVAVFSSTCSFQGFYKVDSVSPKGTKIVVKRDDNHTRTFTDGNIEKNEWSSRSRTAYIRTDVNKVRAELQYREQAQLLVNALRDINVSQNVNIQWSKDTFRTTIAKLDQQLAAAKAMLDQLPE